MDDVRVRRRVSASFQIFTLTTAGGKFPIYIGIKGIFQAWEMSEKICLRGERPYSPVYM